MGSTHRQKVTSKVIFLLHCTGFTQLAFYVSLVGAYNFTICNHTAIKRDYHNMLKVMIEMKVTEENKTTKAKNDIKNCCTMESQVKLLGCIYHFTKDNIHSPEIVNFTDALLKNYCHGNSEVNGSLNHLWTNCKRRHIKHRRYGKLREMWHSYARYI